MTATRRMAGVLSSTQIAAMCGIQLSVLSNWKKRYSDFPEPIDTFAGSDVYERTEVVEWLREHATKRLDQASRTHATAKDNLARAEQTLMEAKTYNSRIRKIRK